MTLTIRARIALTFALLAALLTVSGVLGFISTQKANSANRDTYRNKLAESTAIDNAEIYIARTRLVLDRVALHPEASTVPDQLDRASGFFRNSDEWWSKFQQMPHEPDELPLIAKTTGHRTAMRDAVAAFTRALQAGDKETADNIAMTQLSDLYSKMSAANNEVKKHLYENAKTRYEEAESNFYLFSTVSAVMVVLGLVAAGLGWVMLRRAIMNPLNYALESLQDISAGNLSKPVRAQRNDEMGLLLESIEKTRKELGNVTGSVRSGSESVSVATREIAAGMIDLSARTEEQAASLQETAASMNELTSAVKQNTDNARTGSDLAHTAANVATRGSEMVQRVVDTMSEIEGSSRKIDTAVTQMDEVTQQNAALVEQVTAAAQALDTQSSKLSSTVQVFRVA
ncbi:methyl-accepting chemotaxis protein-1 (serine sensor receptor) [Paraburkholderia bannensis]|uniref:Methyl-accepting chemotaxis protein-1 (Serine sensor receptor) n=1 Tax=Paraburkholderia bannensis TaxID=765414 RepID=A0A7W9WSG6_9BURK|nr:MULTISPECIES: Tar ligand binding domain-containing protein [Paraburkholderia]MBB3257307.1 methyl-accepting chemotaxis protein-1 (serine sensor receptor) [Paraburkholderia sp. WP4_3_2]MBB6102297.1 methyl-accepting chemotaxis protein-1 (serine sensor receptor) [Paraburkholderia bannensis]